MMVQAESILELEKMQTKSKPLMKTKKRRARKSIGKLLKTTLEELHRLRKRVMSLFDAWREGERSAGCAHVVPKSGVRGPHKTMM